MLSQGTSSKSRDRDGAGVSVPANLLVASLTPGELAVALDTSGLPLSRSMTVEQIVEAAAAGVTVLGRDNVRVRDAQIRKLNGLLMYGLLPSPAYGKQLCKLVTAIRRYRLAIDLGWRVEAVAAAAVA